MWSLLTIIHSSLLCYDNDVPFKVSPGGKAMSGGIKEKEYILAINGEDSENLAHHEAQQKIKTTGTTLSLKLST